MWISASRVDSSAHSHADNFAYICIKGPYQCFNPLRAFIYTGNRVPKRTIDCFYVFFPTRRQPLVFIHHSMKINSQRPDGELSACSDIVKQRTCFYFGQSYSTLLLLGNAVANWDCFLGAGGEKFRHPQVNCCLLIISASFKISIQQCLPAGRKMQITVVSSGK